MFEIDPAFTATSSPVGDLALCHVRLQRDARFPWLILIPAMDGLRELEDLEPDQRQRFTEEVVAAGAAVRALGQAMGLPVTKLNIGLLGNVTPQLHAHVVGRNPDDLAWPGPVWGHSAAVDYLEVDLATAIGSVRKTLAL